MINFPVVDSHVHLWDPTRFRYSWLDNLPKLNRPFGVPDFRAACGQVQIAQMVLVEAACDPRHNLEEAVWINSLADQDERLQAIVAAAALEKGTAALPELTRLAAMQRVRGVRRILQSEPDVDFCLRPGFVAGVRLLARFDLSFDLCVNYRHLTNVIKLVQQCPEIRFVLDHAGKPDIRGRQMYPWREQMSELASLPNVWCKISGLVTEADHQAWKGEDLWPYIDHVLECFGFDRVMYGGDWPVVLLASDYIRWVEALLRAVRGCSVRQQTALFSQTARRVYRLKREKPEA